MSENKAEHSSQTSVDALRKAPKSKIGLLVSTLALVVWIGVLIYIAWLTSF